MNSSIRRINFVVLTCSALIAAGCARANYQAFDPNKINSFLNTEPLPTNNTISNQYCTVGNGAAMNVYATQCLTHPALPSNSAGFEMNNLAGRHFVLPANDAINGTSQAVYLYIELSTYVQADTMVIKANNNTDTPVTLLDICNIATYTAGDTTGGVARPYSDTILQFTAQLPAHTTSIDFDFSAVQTLTYIGVWNLNEFSTALSSSSTNPFPSNPNQFRPQWQPLSLYNDNSDPQTGANDSCPSI